MDYLKILHSSNNDGFVEVKSKKNVEIMSLPPTNVYDKDNINAIIQDKFDMEYSSNIVKAKIEFEDMIENDFYLKTKREIQCKSLYEIIKIHSAHYYKIKQDVHKNKSKYL